MAEQPALETKPKDPQVFISYASKDRALAAIVHARLMAAGFRVWFDRARLRPGCDWHKEIEAGCEASRIVLPLLTPNWRMSEWTKYETYAARAIVPVIAEGTHADVLTPPLRSVQAMELDPRTAADAEWRDLFAAIREKLAEPLPEQAPLLTRLAHAPNEYFTGREADMIRLHEELHPGPIPAPTRVRACAIIGLGGLGKTTLANQYVRRFSRLYRQILWVDAARGYQAEFAALHDQMFRDRARPDTPDEEKAARVMDALREPRERLLVLDNIADESSATAWIPREGGCRTLITSRFAGFSPAVRMIPLGEMSVEEAQAFLRTRTGAADDSNQAACEKLARRLGCLPLALEQAGAYMVEQRMGFTKYLRLFEEAAAELLARQAFGSTDYPDSVITTWRVTIARLSPEARAVLRLSAAMGSAPIPLDMLIQSAPRVWLLGATLPDLRRHRLWPAWGRRRGDSGLVRSPPLPDPVKAELAVREAVGGHLHGYSMIQDWNGDSFRVHPLVRDVEWFAMEKGERRYTCGLVARLLETHAPADPSDPGAREACDATLVHGAALRERLLGERLKWRDHKLPGVLYECAVARGAVEAAETYALEHYEEAKANLGPISQVTRNAASRVARSLFDKGNYTDALPILEVMLHACEVQDGPDHPNTLASVNNLAVCMRALGDAAGALPLYRRALASSERVLGAEHPDTLTSVGVLADCLDALGRLDEAAPLHRRRIGGLERRLGAEHPEVLTACNDLAYSLRETGRADLALPYARGVAETSERVLGDMDPLALHRRNNLALTLLMTGEIAEARRLLAGNWAWPAPDCVNTTPDIAFLGLLADLLEGGSGASALGRLKTLLLGPKLPMAAGVAHPWDVGYLLDYMASRLADGDHAFLTALLAAINDPEQTADLDRFPAWREAAPIARDAPWLRAYLGRAWTMPKAKCCRMG